MPFCGSSHLTQPGPTQANDGGSQSLRLSPALLFLEVWSLPRLQKEGHVSCDAAVEKGSHERSIIFVAVEGVVQSILASLPCASSHMETDTSHICEGAGEISRF